MPSSVQSLPFPPAPLLKAARRLLRPLVRMMMRNGLTFPILAEALRRLFVDVAVNDILTDPKARTDSRISLLTGVHRKELKRLRDLPADATHAPDVVTLASEIVARWVGSAPFIGPNGQPRPLHRAHQEAPHGAPSFDTLVALVTSDVRPRAVLDDLLGHGIVSVDAADRVQLNQQAFIPRPGGDEQLFYFARNLHDHAAAAVANISAGAAPPFLDRSVHYDRLTPAQATALQECAREAAMRALLEVNRRAIELTESETACGPGLHRRVNFGLYVYNEDDKPDAESLP